MAGEKESASISAPKRVIMPLTIFWLPFFRQHAAVSEMTQLRDQLTLHGGVAGKKLVKNTP
jgi:hypothetical protein